MTVNYIAICYLGAGSVYGQAETYEEAVKIAAREAVGFAKPFGGLKTGTELPMGVFDYRPWDSITWSDGHTYGHTAKDGSGDTTRIEPDRIVTIDPKTREITEDLTYEQWRTAQAAAALG